MRAPDKRGSIVFLRIWSQIKTRSISYVLILSVQANEMNVYLKYKVKVEEKKKGRRVHVGWQFATNFIFSMFPQFFINWTAHETLTFRLGRYVYAVAMIQETRYLLSSHCELLTKRFRTLAKFDIQTMLQKANRFHSLQSSKFVSIWCQFDVINVAQKNIFLICPKFMRTIQISFAKYSCNAINTIIILFVA